MAKVVNIAGGSYTVFGGVRLYTLTTAVTANSTVVAGARQGDLIKTTHATGRMSLFVADSAHTAQYLTNS